MNPFFLRAITPFSPEFDRPLAPLSTMRVGGKARVFIEPQSESALVLLTNILKEFDVRWHILSGGSNTLFSDEGFDGVVIKLGAPFNYINHLDNQTLKVGALCSFVRLAKVALALGFKEAVGFMGVPGLVGGAVRMNAGTRFGVIGDVVERVYGIYRGEAKEFAKEELTFSYRSVSLPPGFIVTGTLLKINQEENSELLLSQAETYRSYRRVTQPNDHSLGSFFKNPVPSFAGALIEQSGLKGQRIGGAAISSMHANFLINDDNAKALDVLNLGSLVQKIVFEKHGIGLVPEIHLAGDFSSQPLSLDGLLSR